MFDNSEAYQGSTEDWLLEFYNEFVLKVEEQIDIDFFMGMGLSASDFEYLKDITNPDTQRLLPKLVNYVESHPHFFNIRNSQDIANICMSLIIGYTAGLKDIL